MVELKRVIKPAVWLVYVLVVFEILFMISPFALHFYAAYGPTLNVLHRSSATAWLTQFYLPHFTETASPVLNAVGPLGGALIAVGLTAFLVAAIPVYWAKFRGRGPVTGGLYATIRHPQYVALAITGLGTALLWPRFLVLVTFVTMIFLYAWLAQWEEQQCVARFGDSYRDYQKRSGRFVPKRLADRLPTILPRKGTARRVILAVAWPVTTVLTVAVGFMVRDHALGQVAAIYADDRAVLSPARLSTGELRTAYELSLTHPEVQHALEGASDARFVVYVVPSEWLLPDLPLDVEHPPRGHHVPRDFDRTRHKVLVTRARFHGAAPSGAGIVKAAYGRYPLVVAHVDLRAGAVEQVLAAPPQVFWGDIPTPMF